MVFGLVFLTIAGCVRKASLNQIESSIGQSIDYRFRQNFKLLDSSSRAVKSDTIIYCCIGAIAFMEKHTKIPASSPGGFSGKMYFTKGDLRKWHQWYKERTGK